MDKKNSKRNIIVGVMGGGKATSENAEMARRLGRLIAQAGWVLLNGGRSAGIMAASAKGAREEGGLTVGILPDDNDSQVASDIDIPILTGMGSARNSINVLSSRVVVACPGGAGTLSEIALALKNRRPVILLNFDLPGLFEEYAIQGLLHRAPTPEAAVAIIRTLIAGS